MILAVSAVYLYLVLAEVHDVPLPDARIDVTSAFWTEGDIRTIPSELEYGKLVSLSNVDNLELWTGEKSASVSSWFTSIITLNVPPNRVWGLYIPKISIGSVVYVNGHLIGESSKNSTSMGGKYGFIYLNIPNGMLQPGDNEIQIGVLGQNISSGNILSPYLLGSDSELFPAILKALFVVADLPKLVLVILLFSAIVFGSISFYCPDERLYGVFSIVCFLWFLLSIVNIKWMVSDEYNMLINVVNGLFLIGLGATLLVFCTCFTKAELPKYSYRASLAAVGLLMLSTIVLSLVFGGAVLIVVNYVCFFALVSFALYLLISTSDLFIEKTNYLLMFCMMVILVSVVENLRRELTAGDSALGKDLFLISTLFVFTMSVWLLRDFIASRSELADMNRQLESRVEHRTRQLTESFEANRKLERAAVLSEERQRIMMDMHDGIGNHLVALVAHTQSPTADLANIRDSAGEALTDLRLVVDSISPSGESLTSTLAMFRHRLSKNLPDERMKIVWKMDIPGEENHQFSPGKSLQILRILQEACSNAIKYSSGDSLTIHTGETSEHTFIHVSDNGSGFRDENTKGHGLRNMKRRAVSAGMLLDISSTSKGVSVYLVVDPVV